MSLPLLAYVVHTRGYGVVLRHRPFSTEISRSSKDLLASGSESHAAVIASQGHVRLALGALVVVAIQIAILIANDELCVWN